jgi:hypothetical protein
MALLQAILDKNQGSISKYLRRKVMISIISIHYHHSITDPLIYLPFCFMSPPIFTFMHLIFIICYDP